MKLIKQSRTNKIKVKNQRQEHLSFTKKNLLIESSSWNIRHIVYLIRKFGAFLIDNIFNIVMLYLLYAIFEINLFLSLFIAFVSAILWAFFFMKLLKGATLGMFLARLVIVNRRVLKIENSSLTKRALVMGFYWFPLVGLVLVLTSFLSSLVLKGLTLSDLFSSTSVITKEYQEHIENLDKEQKWKRKI